MHPRLYEVLADIALCVAFFTRVPVPAFSTARGFADALWAAPLAGALIGLASGTLLLLGAILGLPPAIAAMVGIGASIALTGALHEDGAADLADGLGGGRTRWDKLDIMRDSRIGSYGTLALVLSVLARWSALAAILSAAGTGAGMMALVSAHAASRAVLPAFAAHVPPARGDGLSAGIGSLPSPSVGLALGLGFLALLLSGFTFALAAAVLLAGIAFAMERLSLQQLGGQTGDVLGALQQLCEVALLMALTAFLVP